MVSAGATEFQLRSDRARREFFILHHQHHRLTNQQDLLAKTRPFLQRARSGIFRDRFFLSYGPWRKRATGRCGSSYSSTCPGISSNRMSKKTIGHLALQFILVSLLVTGITTKLFSQESAFPNHNTAATASVSIAKDRAGSIERQLAKVHQVASPALVRVYGQSTDRGLKAAN